MQSLEETGLAKHLAAQGLKVETRAGRGRCLVADRTISSGALVFSQSPYAHVLDEANQGSLCDACFVAAGEALRRCGGCKLVMYCGPKCQRSAWQLHQHECKAVSALRKRHGTVPTPTLRLAFRVMVKRHLQDNGLFERDAIDDYARVETLVSHLEDAPQDTVLLYAQMATLVKAMGDVEGSKVSIDPREVTELLGRFACNAHTICDEELKPVGMGLFVVNSLANHDCEPNAIILYDGPNAVMRAIREIAAGTEITHAYTDLAGTRNERRERLRKYFFECECKRCLDYRSDPVECTVAGLRCADETCGGSLGWDRELGQRRRDQEGRYICVRCGRSVSADQAEARQEEAKQILREAQEHEAGGDLTAARRLVEQGHIVQASVLHALNWDLVRTRDALVRICMSLEDWPAAAQWCERTLPAYKACLPQPSALHGLQLFTLAKLRWYLEEPEPCLDAIQNAGKILAVTHGAGHRLVSEARELIGQAQMMLNQSTQRMH